MSKKIYAINPQQFAIACVQSSSHELTVEQKLDLYKSAFDQAKALQAEANAEIEKQDEADAKATKDALNKFFGTNEF